MTARSLASLLASLANSRWALTRTLRSDNPHDFNGQLRGSATFTPLVRDPHGPDQPPATPTDQNWVYSEEGEMPAGLGSIAMAGMRWTKKYIWRLNSEAERISVWFVKVAPGPDEADYLFHNFEFSDAVAKSEDGDSDLVRPPSPPAVPEARDKQEVLEARGNHLCIKDMYHTAYAFRIQPDTGEVLSWASRHVVHGPKKNQDIVNQYERAS